MSVLLTRKAVLQANIETTYDVAVDVGVSDGFLVNNPMFSVKPNVLERNFVRQDLSPMPVIIGRKIASMTFETELRGNGVQNSGLLGDAPLIARLFRGCGYALSSKPYQSVLGPFDVGDPHNTVAWALTSGTKASASLPMSDTPSNNQTVTIGSKIYKWVSASPTSDGDVLIGLSATTAVNNLAAAINLGAGAGALYASATTAQPEGIVGSVPSSATLKVTAPKVGSYWNRFATTTTTSQGIWGSATLVGGANIATNTDAVAYYLTVTSAGVSGSAQIAITSDTAGEGSAAATITSGSPFTVGTKGLTLTPTFTNDIVVGQQWVLWLLPNGLALSPVSDNFESLTLVMHKDGVKHVMPGSFGTFEVTAQAGNFATVKWTFTGTYVAPADDPNPLPVFERTLPSQVQLARLTVNQFKAVVDKFTFNQGNDIQIRPDVSSSDGYIGVRITNRKPEGGIDPEADLVANNDFWGQMAAALRMPFQMRVGSVAGNTVWLFAPNTQYSGMTYTDRNGILAYDAGLRFARSNGDDEFMLFLC